MARPSVVRDRYSVSSRIRHFLADYRPRIAGIHKLGLAIFLGLFFGGYVLALLTALGSAVATIYFTAIGAVHPVGGIAFATAGAATTALLLLLGRGFTRAGDFRNAESIELTRHDEPDLFALLDELCDQSGASPPDRVFARPDVNAGVFVEYSAFNPFHAARKHLLIGLGMINVLNRTEMKAVLAHEFGHFSQRSMWLHHHAQLAFGLFDELLDGCDRIDALVARWRRRGFPGTMVGRILAAIAHLIRRTTQHIAGLLHRLESAVSRQMELDADQVAVNTTGGDAIAHALDQVELAERCYAQTLYDLEHAAKRDLRSDDLYYHHANLIEELYERNNGLPDLTDNSASQNTSHPSKKLRQRKACSSNRSGALDRRSAWSLLSDPEQLRQTVTQRIYTHRWDVDATPRDASTVQAFLDGEHAEMLLDEEARKVYGHRFIEPGDLASATTEADNDESTDAKLRDHIEQLTGADFREAQRRVRRNLRSSNDANPAADPAEDHRWLANRDRRLLVATLCVAKRRGPEYIDELLARYSFHLHLQDLIRWLRQHTPILGHIFTEVDIEKLDADETGELVDTLQSLHEGLRRGLDDAPAVPELHGLSPNQPLSMVVLESPLIDVDALKSDDVDPQWLDEFTGQWQQAVDRLHHLRWKSLGALLLYQRRLHSTFLQA